MPSNHFRCPLCGWFGLICYRAQEVDLPECWPPPCPACARIRVDAHHTLYTPMVFSPQPGDFTMDARSDGGTGQGFQKFSVDVDGRAVEIDSLHKLRTVERDSEQRYRNGEGEPLRFRAFSQNASNRDVGSFEAAGKIGERAYDSGIPAPVKKPEKIGIRRHGTTTPKLRVARGGGQSPLSSV